MNPKGQKSFFSILAVAAMLSGCAADPGGRNGGLFSNAAKAHIYTQEEQENMTANGTIPTMIAPSELRDYFKNAKNVTKPTGEVNYCDAGLPALVQSRRNQALAAIDEACGGKDKYSIRHEGPGHIKARHLGSIQLTPGCSRSKVIIFRCAGVQPKPDMRK